MKLHSVLLSCIMLPIDLSKPHVVDTLHAMEKAVI